MKLADTLVTCTFLTVILVFLLLFANELSGIRWEKGIIKGSDNETITVLCDSGEVQTLKFSASKKIIVVDMHIRYCYVVDEMRMIDFWYDSENIELRK